MSWEKRGDWGPYYTRSRRQGGKIQREYVGTGKPARIIATFDDLDREEREAKAWTWREQKARDAELDGMIAEIVTATDALATAALIRAGYYQHHRTWRRRGGA